jgi:hypothetical protein
LDQNLREPEVVGCCIENAVQHDGHISFEAGEATLPEVAVESYRHSVFKRRTSDATIHILDFGFVVEPGYLFASCQSFNVIYAQPRQPAS